MLGIFKSKKGIAITILIVVAVLMVGIRVANQNKQKKAKEEETKATIEKNLQALEDSYSAEGYEGSDSMLMSMQEDLVQSYGKLPDRYIWNIDGTLMSQGDKDMTAEEVVYSYLNGLRTLDISTAQKYSRDSTVVSTYEGYFNEQDRNTDYTDTFLRNMYRQALLSFQVKGIVNSSVFAENKQVFTVKVKMLDLTQKDFWYADKEKIYKDLKLYSSDESDSTKADIYLYDYISSYYERDDCKMRDVTFDLTVQRYPDLDTGWLVSIDTDVDSACRYADGNIVVNYIYDMYQNEGLEYLQELEEEVNEDGQ